MSRSGFEELVRDLVDRAERLVSAVLEAAGGLSGAEVEALAEKVRQEALEGPEKREPRRFRNLIYSNERIFEQVQEIVDEKAGLEAAVFDLGEVSRKLDETARTRTAPPLESKVLQRWEPEQLRTFLRDLLPVAERLFARFQDAIDQPTEEWVHRALDDARRALDGGDRAAVLTAALEFLAILRELDPDDPAAVAVLRWFLDEDAAG